MSWNRSSEAFSFSRRRFLAQAAGLGMAGFAAPPRLSARQKAASDRLNIAVIGAMGKGKSDTANVIGEHNIVALADVDSRSLSAAAALCEKAAGGKKKSGQAPRQYADFRQMLDEMAPRIDAVIVSTPDHTHFVAALRAIRHGKHVAVQKPLCNTIHEVRELHQAAKQAGVVTQMGNQGRTMEGQRLAKEWIEQGAIGTLKEVRLWTNRPIWPQGPLTKKPAEKPDSLAWDLWLASEPSEPYFEFELPRGASGRKGNSVHPFNWRGWWQFGSGALGDMGCHVMDATFNILGRRVPDTIEAQSGPISDSNAPVWSTLQYHFGATERLPALVVSWHDGERDGQRNKPERDPRVPVDVFSESKTGMMLIGTDGLIFEGKGYCAEPVIYPAERFADVQKAMQSGRIRQTEPRSPHPGNPQLEWAEAIVHGGTPSSNFDYAGPLTEFVLLGNLAIRSGKPIQWDREQGRVTNLDAANRFTQRPNYRDGWL